MNHFYISAQMFFIFDDLIITIIFSPAIRVICMKIAITIPLIAGRETTIFQHPQNLYWKKIASRATTCVNGFQCF